MFREVLRTSPIGLWLPYRQRVVHCCDNLDYSLDGHQNLQSNITPPTGSSLLKRVSRLFDQGLVTGGVPCMAVELFCRSALAVQRRSSISGRPLNPMVLTGLVIDIFVVTDPNKAPGPNNSTLATLIN